MNTRIEPHMSAAEVKRRALAEKSGVVRLWEMDGSHADSLTLLNLFTSFPDHYDGDIATIMIEDTRYAVTSLTEDEMKLAVLVDMTEHTAKEEPVKAATTNPHVKKSLEGYIEWWQEGLKRDGIELVVPDSYIKETRDDATLKGSIAPPPMINGE